MHLQKDINDFLKKLNKILWPPLPVSLVYIF